MTGISLIFIACLLWALDTLIRYPLLFGGLSPRSIVWPEHVIFVAVMLYCIVPMVRTGAFNATKLSALMVIAAGGRSSC